MSGIREKKKNATKQAIQLAAVKFFAEKGFENTSLEEIGAVAGIGKTTIYGYFANKKDIFLNFCDDELEQEFSRLQAMDHAEKPLVDLLVDFFMIKFTFMTRNHELGRQMLREMIFPCEINEKARNHDQRYFDILEGFLKNAQERGEIVIRHDLFSLCVHFFSLYLGLLAGWYTGYLKSLPETEEAMKKLFNQVLEGISA